MIDRVGKRLRCTWSWYSGRWKKVVKGQNLLGIVLTINGKALPIHLLFCSKQGCKNTDKPSLLISMLTRLKTEFAEHEIDITTIPITMDSWYVSEPLNGNKRLNMILTIGGLMFLHNGQSSLIRALA